MVCTGVLLYFFAAGLDPCNELESVLARDRVPLDFVCVLMCDCVGERAKKQSEIEKKKREIKFI